MALGGVGKGICGLSTSLTSEELERLGLEKAAFPAFSSALLPACSSANRGLEGGYDRRGVDGPATAPPAPCSSTAACSVSTHCCHSGLDASYSEGMREERISSQVRSSLGVRRGGGAVECCLAGDDAEDDMSVWKKDGGRSGAAITMKRG